MSVFECVGGEGHMNWSGLAFFSSGHLGNMSREKVLCKSVELNIFPGTIFLELLSIFFWGADMFESTNIRYFSGLDVN